GGRVGEAGPWAIPGRPQGGGGGRRRLRPVPPEEHAYFHPVEKGDPRLLVDLGARGPAFLRAVAAAPKPGRVLGVLKPSPRPRLARTAATAPSWPWSRAASREAVAAPDRRTAWKPPRVTPTTRTDASATEPRPVRFPTQSRARGSRPAA